MSKIHLGKRGSEVGFWVAAPGWNASNPGDKMIFDSNRDSFQIHQIVTATMVGQNYNPQSGYVYYPQKIYFSPLAYRPLVFPFFDLSYTGSLERYYPQTTISEYGNEGYGGENSWVFSIGFDHIEVEKIVGKNIHVPEVYVTVYVYKNRLIV